MRGRSNQENPLPARNLSENSGNKRIRGKNYYVNNLKEIRRKKEEFDKRQKEIEESNKESNWKMKKFLRIESSNKRSKKTDKQAQEAEQKKIKERLKELNKSDFIKKNILKVQVKKPEQKLVEVSDLNPEFGKVPK